MSDPLRLGERGETLARDYLRRQGYSILEKNYRTRFGEIDIVAEKKGTLVFFEVKTRRNADFGLPAESVDRRKQEKLGRMAEAFLQTKRFTNRPARFDILSIIWDGSGEPQFSLLEDAFSLEER